MQNTLHLDPLFQINTGYLSTDERISLSYRRARKILQTYRLSSSDVLHCSPAFWKLHLDPIFSLDIACFTIVAAHLNLTVGTIVKYLHSRPDLQLLIDSMLRLDIVGVYLLSERGHGLDVFNLETTATKTKDGFVLNTPCEGANKFMPATTPLFGMSKVAVVMARLYVDNQSRGLRWFLVPICDEHKMHAGVISRRLPTRSGTAPLDFSLTSFHAVHLPDTALLGDGLEAPALPHEAWWREVWRLPLGTLAVNGPFIQATKQAAYIGGKYSLYRTIRKGPSALPIIAFPTQQWPILHAIAVSFVNETWLKATTVLVSDNALDPRVRHGLAVAVKTVVTRHFQRCVDEIAERCGALGTFEENFMAGIMCDGRGVIIAEGDVLTLCIRLFSDLMHKRYAIPLPRASDSLLARHAHSVLDQSTHILNSLKNEGEAQSFILLQSEHAVSACGHALAYAAARVAKVPQTLLDLYECGIIRRDPAWYLEHSGITRLEQIQRELRAMRAAYPRLRDYLDALGIEPYVRAPIVKEEKLKEMLTGLPKYQDKAEAKL